MLHHPISEVKKLVWIIGFIRTNLKCSISKNLFDNCGVGVPYNGINYR